jgi:alpha-glucosidase
MDNKTPYIMKQIFVLLVVNLICLSCSTQKMYTVSSPDKNISVSLSIDKAGIPIYTVSYQNTLVIENSKLGLIREDGDFSKGLSLVSADDISPVTDAYELLTAKRRLNKYFANKQVFHLKNSTGKLIDIIFQVSDDGLALRYYFPESSNEIFRIKEEITSFRFPVNTKAWLQPLALSKSGWESTNPSYEESYQKGIDAGTSSPTEAGWAYPALFNAGNCWILITESFLERNYCGTRLKQFSPAGEYSVGFPDQKEIFPGGPAFPQSALPWYTPWRVITVGSLKTIIESTLGSDLAKPAIEIDKSFIKPGIASWSWVLLKDDSTVYGVQKRFIDYASDMNWKYCLVDADWDKKIGYDKIKELAEYGRTKNVGLILWYNSAGSWNTVKYTPKDKLLTKESRAKEFDRLRQMGIKGVKIDFFGGDGQSMIAYYHDILQDAAKYNILVNFHGATLPRGWQRTYPHLMTMEAIRGMEMITFDQGNADEEPAHATTIPFTRNAFDPMDFTPMALYKIPNINRKTTSAFELATSVIFLSGIQHMAETPEGMSHVPDFVKNFLRELPVSWDEVRFIDGYPGKLAVIARKSGSKWYVAGINGENQEKILKLDLSFLTGYEGMIITDGKEELSFTQNIIPAQKETNITVMPNGGFVMVFSEKK